MMQEVLLELVMIVDPWFEALRRSTYLLIQLIDIECTFAIGVVKVLFMQVLFPLLQMLHLQSARGVSSRDLGAVVYRG